MAIWNDKWFAGQSMPAHGFPLALLEVAQAVAEEWLFDPSVTCVLAEWVSAAEAAEHTGGLLWSGFALRGQPDKRIAPKPVLVRLLYTEPRPEDVSEVHPLMRQFLNRAQREWIKAFQKHGRDLIVAP